MAEKNTDKEALKAQKEAEKAAKKAKKERIKQSKPKKEGNIFTRVAASVKRFFKDFIGTCKKVVWTKGSQVLKNTGVVIATIIVIGLAVFAIDWALTQIFDLGKDLAVQAGQQRAAVTETTQEATLLPEESALTLEENTVETSEEITEETTAEESTAASD